MTDQTEIVHQPDGMQAIAALIEGGKVESGQLRELFALQCDVRAENAREDFVTAIAEFQAVCPRIAKKRTAAIKSKNSNDWEYKFAAFEDIMAEIAEPLKNAGLTIGFSSEVSEGLLHTTCHLSRGIHTQSYKTSVAIPTTMRVNDTQQMGAAMSYGKRYALIGALNIVVEDEDNDAQGLAGTINEDAADKLRELCKEAGRTEAQVLEFYKLDSFNDLPTAVYAGCEHMLQLIIKGRS